MSMMCPLQERQRLTQLCGKLYGRDDEIQRLRQVQTKARNNLEGIQLVLLAGDAGCGKSSLMTEVFHDSRRCLYGMGKFEQEQRSDMDKPYTVLMNCLSYICREMIRHDEDEDRIGTYDDDDNDSDDSMDYTSLTIPSPGDATSTNYASRIRAQLKPEDISRLAVFIPELDELLKLEDDGVGQTVAVATNANPLKYALQCFLRAIAMPERPLILFLDDIHWMDHGTLDLVESILKDKRLHNVILAGTYRNNEKTSGQHVMNWICKITCAKEADEVSESLASVQTITVGDVTIRIIENILSDLLSLDIDDVHELARLIHTRTNGNIFHVLKLIDYLEDHNLIEFSIPLACWTFDIEQIRDKTTVSENVLSIVGIKLRNLPRQVQECLKLCSCLGSRFEEKDLLEIQSALSSSKDDSVEEQNTVGDVSLCLDIASGAGLLERLGCRNEYSCYKFAHDKVFEAVLRMFSNASDRNKTHFEIGKLLWRGRFCDNSLNTVEQLSDEDIFLCAGQLNRGREFVTDLSFRVKLAELNWHAAQRAEAKSAFFPAVALLEVGVGLLQPLCWEAYYDLSLKLYTSLAEMASKAGQVETQALAVSTVLAHARSVDDAIRVHLVSLEHNLAQLKHEEQILASLSVLRLFGETIPEKPGGLYKNRVFRRTKQLVLAMTDEDVVSLPIMNNKRIEAAVQILASLAQPAYNIGNHNLSTVCVCRAVYLTVHHGVAPHSPFAMSWLGTMAISEQDDVDAAYRFCKILGPLREKLTMVEPNGRDTVISCGVIQWREPLSHQLDTLIEGHKNGMRIGDCFSAFLNVTVYGYSYYLAGLPMGPLVDDMEDYVHLMMEYNNKFWLLINLPLYQCILNLTGRSRNILDSTQTEKYRSKLGWESRTGEETDWSYRMQIAFYCEDFQMATDYANKLMAISPGQARTFPYYQTRVFFFVLIALLNAKRCSKTSRLRKRKYVKIAKKYYTMVKSWVLNKKAINMAHKLRILDAEMKSMKKNVDKRELMLAYDGAISSSTRCGFLNDAALAAHLASRAPLVNEDCRTRLLYYERAMELYESWGATGLIDILCENSMSGFSSIMLTDGMSRSVSRRQRQQGGGQQHGSSDSQHFGFRSRKRFDQRLSQQHKELAGSQLFELDDHTDETEA